MAHYILYWPAKIFGLEQQRLTSPIQVLFFLGLCLAGINLINTYYDYKTYSGTDLRIRIVGARAMLQGINPYTLDYSLDLPETLQDPDQYQYQLSRCVYPPSLLLFYTPLSILPYQLIRALSMILEWLALIVAIALLARTLPQKNYYRAGFVIIALIGFAGNYFWRLHIERGQYHVFLVLLLAFWVYESLKHRNGFWKKGICLGLALSIQPTILVILCFLVIPKHYKTITVALGTGVIIVLLTLPFGGLRFWVDWTTLVNRYENAGLRVPLKNVSKITKRYPAEGFQPRNVLRSPTANSSAIEIFYKVQKKYNFAPETTKLIIKAVFLSIFLLFLVLFVWANSRRKFNFRFFLAFALFVSIITEFIAPIRFGYANVRYLLFFAPLLPFLFHPKNCLFLAIMLLGLMRTKSDMYQSITIILPITVIFVSTIVNRITKPAKNDTIDNFR